MPSRFRKTARPPSVAGRANSFRHHHPRANGLSGAMGRSEKFFATGYVIPGNVRRFIPKNGSGYVPFSTRAPTTVLGTVMADHAEASKPGCDTDSPPASTRAEDCSPQPSRRTSRPPGCAEEEDDDAAQAAAPRTRRRKSTAYSKWVRCPRVSVLAVALLVTAVSAPAQPPPATFPSKVELITVDAVVLDAQGHPVPGLKREDFILEEDGRPQEISSFEAFVAAPPAATKATAPPALASKEGERPGGSRPFALVLDGVGMVPRDAIEARRAVETFLARSVRDGDEVSL